jgi:alpha-L-fucosidase 2
MDGQKIHLSIFIIKKACPHPHLKLISKMKKTAIIFFISIITYSSFAQKKLVLWYQQPAKDWNEALPVGNGRLGAMIFGRASDELIQLNEQSLWTGGPVDPNPNPEAPKYLQPVRDLLFKDSIAQAVKLLRKMQGPNTEMYQPLGDIIIRQQLKGDVSDYYRGLDISKAVATTRFTVDGVTYTREIFSSAPDQVIIIRIKASKPHSLSFSVGVDHELKFQRSFNDNDEIILKGKARITNDERRVPKPFIYEDSLHRDGMRYQFRIKVITNGSKDRNDSMLLISNATEALLYVSAATSYNGYDKYPDKDGKDENKIALKYLNAAVKKNFSSLLSAHVADYQKYFNRVSLSINGDKVADMPTDKRLSAYKLNDNDPALEELYFQYGRYLLISSSRPGGIPANLQGIWNKEIRPSWRSNYTTNINVQMNYWPAEVCNLSEMAQPLMQQIKRWSVNGTATAKNYYNMHGWALHHNSDIWAQTNPVGEGGGDPKWANWALGSPWISQHLYEHYRFTSDKKFLKEFAYPIMKSAATFCLDWLVEKEGRLVTAPSTSPENIYVLPNGTKGTVTVASAMDMEIIWDLFTNIIEADSILNFDREFASLLRSKRDKLSPLKIGKEGNLVEWYGDWKDEDPQHRHVSHLFALHPGREISPLLDPEFAAASHKTLEVRGDGGTGWSKAWKINFWARLLDGDHAYKMYRELLKQSTLNNLFDTHPPFQIDGNFGATAGVSEMLLQSHLSEIQLLPALPSRWKNGSVKGLVARGNFVVNMVWNNNQLTNAKIVSRAGEKCILRTKNRIKVIGALASSRKIDFNNETNYITIFNTVAGKSYTINAQL